MQLHFSIALYFLLHSLCCPQQKKTFVSNRKTSFIYQNLVHFFCFSFCVLRHTAACSKTGLSDKSCLVQAQILRIRSVGVFWQRPVSLCCSCCCCCSIACCSQLTPSENQQTLCVDTNMCRYVCMCICVSSCWFLFAAQLALRWATVLANFHHIPTMC